MSYCVRADVEMVYGVENVKQWADYDNDQVAAKIAARIETAIGRAAMEIDDRLRGGPYTIPFVGTPPNSIIDAAAVLAGAWLYRPRGQDDSENETGPQALRQEVREKLVRLHAGIERLDLTTTTCIPQVVTEDS